MVHYVAPGIILPVLEPPYIIYRNPTCKDLSNNIAARDHPRAGSKQMASTYQAVVAQTQSSSSSSNLCCSVATQTWSAHVAYSLLHTIYYASSMNAVCRRGCKSHYLVFFSSEVFFNHSQDFRYKASGSGITMGDDKAFAFGDSLALGP